MSQEVQLCTLDNLKGALSPSNKSIDPSEPLRIISHVCRYWRAILSDAPLLWSQVIDCGFIAPMWLKTILDYAKDAPLSVRFDHQSRYGQRKKNNRPSNGHKFVPRADFQKRVQGIPCELFGSPALDSYHCSFLGPFPTSYAVFDGVVAPHALPTAGHWAIIRVFSIEPISRHRPIQIEEIYSPSGSIQQSSNNPLAKCHIFVNI